jgi:CRISPR/Cas system endoribonuclease Cas6 (RAMP superfamily)
LYPAVKQFKLAEFHRAYAQQQLAENRLAAARPLASRAKRKEPTPWPTPEALLAEDLVGARRSLKESARRG